MDRKSSGKVAKIGKKLENDLHFGQPPTQRGLVKAKPQEGPSYVSAIKTPLRTPEQLSSNESSPTLKIRRNNKEADSGDKDSLNSGTARKRTPPPVAPKPKLETTFPSELGSPTTIERFDNHHTAFDSSSEESSDNSPRKPPKVPEKKKSFPPNPEEEPLHHLPSRGTSNGGWDRTKAVKRKGPEVPEKKHSISPSVEPPPRPNTIIHMNSNDRIADALDEILSSDESESKASFLNELETVLTKDRSNTGTSNEEGQTLSPNTPKPDGENFFESAIEEGDSVSSLQWERNPGMLQRRETSSAVFVQVIEEFVRKKLEKSDQLAQEFPLPTNLRDSEIEIPPDIGALRQKKTRAPERSKSAAISKLSMVDRRAQNRLSVPHNNDSGICSIDRESMYSQSTIASDELDRSMSGAEDEATSEEKEQKLTEKRKRRLKMITREFITTELTYIETLGHLSEDFPEFIDECGEKLGTPLLQPGGSNVIDRIRKEILQIKPLHLKLAQEFLERVNNWDADNPNFASVLSTYAPMIKMCSNFLKIKSDLAKDLISAQKNSTHFAKAVKEFERRYFNGLRLADTLDCVHQRVTRYPLLLNTYIKYLTPDCEEYERAMTKKKTEAVAMEVEHHLFEGESTKILLELHRRLQGDFSVIEPGRKLLKEGPLNKLSRKELNSRYLVLFTDVLLYCRPTTPGDLLVIIEAVLIAEISKVEIPTHEEYNLQFSIYRTKHRSFTFVAKSVLERKDWTDAIEQAIRNRHSSTEQKKVEKPGHQPPPWINDKEVTMCQACAKHFSLFNRRHHCRGCGQVLCDECCGLAPILYKEFEPGRVCPQCYASIEDEVVTGALSRIAIAERNISLSYSPDSLRSLLRPPKPVARARLNASNNSGSLGGRYHTDDEVEVEGSLMRVNGKSSKQYWAVLDKQHMLLLYSAHKDKVPESCVMVLGTSLEVTEEEHNWVVFQLSRQNQIQTADGRVSKDVFKCKSGKLAERWREALEAAAEG